MSVAHRAAQKFNEAALRHPEETHEQWRSLQSAFLAGGVTFDGKPMATLLRPQFVDRATWGQLLDGASRLVDLCDRVSREAFGGDDEALMDFLCVGDLERSLLRVKSGTPDVLLSRVDAFIDEGGHSRFIEINSDAPAGFGYADRMARAFQTLPLMRATAREFGAQHVDSIPALASTLRSQSKVARPVVAIVDLRDVRTRPDQEIIAQELAAHGIDTFLCDPRDMEIAGQRLTCAGKAVDIVYRRTVIAELLAIREDAQAFLDAYARGLATFVNPFRCYLSEDKAFFALLTDERFGSLLSEDERAFVERAVPWTRKVEERRTQYRDEICELLPHITTHRDALVLKPSHAYGGRAVFIGSETEPSAWHDAVNHAVRTGGWIVQEKVTIPQEEFPFVTSHGTIERHSLKVNTNPFYAGPSPTGAVTRVSRDSVINVSAGGGSVPCFIVG